MLEIIVVVLQLALGVVGLLGLGAGVAVGFQS